MVYINHTELLSGRAVSVEIKGELDSAAVPDFEAYINSLLEKKIYFVLLDAGKLNYISSGGFGLLLLLQKKISEKNGFVVIFNISVEITTLFTLFGFDKIFRLAPGRPEAIDILDRQMEFREKGEASTGGLSPNIEEEIPPTGGSSSVSEDARAEKGEDSYVVECPRCQTLLRTTEKGEYICPNCAADLYFDGGALQEKKQPSPAVEAAAPQTGGLSHPLVIECEKCKALVRVSESGEYRCSDCGAPFTVSEEGTVRFG